jgi:hypothetical protein
VVSSVALGGENLGWGSHLDVGAAKLRHRYLQALHAADMGDMSQLMEEEELLGCT